MERRNATVSDTMPDNRNGGVRETPDKLNFENSHHPTASYNKIFVGGLDPQTRHVRFIKHFGKYGKITDAVIMRDRDTGISRGFGFVTYADASVADRVIEETHIINGKQVEVKIPRPRSGDSKDIMTKKIYVGGIPKTVSEVEFRDCFSKYGEVQWQQIIKDHSTGQSRGFGFITFESEQCVDDLLQNGNMLYLGGSQVEIKKAVPKKPNIPAPPSRHQSNSRVASGGGHRDDGGSSRAGDYGRPAGYSGTAHGGDGHGRDRGTSMHRNRKGDGAGSRSGSGKYHPYER